jgi:hypothetical protein
MTRTRDKTVNAIMQAWLQHSANLAAGHSEDALRIAIALEAVAAREATATPPDQETAAAPSPEPPEPSAQPWATRRSRT